MAVHSNSFAPIAHLDVIRRAIFSAACAARVLGDLAGEASEETFERATSDLAYIWANCSLAPLGGAAVSERRAYWMEAVCAEGGSLEGSNVVMVLIAALDAVGEGSADAAIRCAGGATNAVFEQAQRRGLPADRASVMSAAWARNEGGMDAEWARQQRDLEALAAVDDRDLADLAVRLRERAMRERTGPT